jgi:hypothetical protein
MKGASTMYDTVRRRAIEGMARELHIKPEDFINGTVDALIKHLAERDVKYRRILETAEAGIAA